MFQHHLAVVPPVCLGLHWVSLFHLTKNLNINFKGQSDDRSCQLYGYLMGYTVAITRL